MMQSELEAARTLAVRAGAILLEHYSSPDVRWKGPGNPVTEADRAASAFLVKEFKRRFPEDGVLSEEDAGDDTRLSLSRVWIIDPLDGTIEFINHRHEFAVMIGLSIDGAASLGVVYQPLTEKLYYAAAGIGAFLIENRSSRLLRVSTESNPLAMTLALSRSHHSADIDAVQRRLGVRNSLTSGSMGLKVGLICEGQAHLYIHTSSNTSQWDTCAPDIILREAGGRMTDLFNTPLRYNGSEVRNLHGVVASNGTIHEHIAAAAKAALTEQL
jgi:3'(2'), 5'-bisphosphate nucleotidase